MNMQDFKNEFRLICTDTWGNAMDCWFEVAGHLFNRGLAIPANWIYSPGMSPTDEDNYFYEIFGSATDEQLSTIGAFLFRYCQYLKYKRIDY